ncbi:SxtJ family membrane protein [Aliiglaciecola litoralis]|uniref:SxtJ n=1 Tax=Aliiglaciecola litoralis TaxID=582857 RepID=A0ABP3WW57_9ALTE
MLTLLKKHDHQGLREFSVTMMWVFPLVFMLLLPWLFEQPIPWWPAIFSGCLAILYFVYPTGLYIPYRIWMAIASVLGWVNTRLILGIAFYLLILPIGLVLRLFKKLQYQHKPAQQDSYWITSEPRKDSVKLKDPF